MHRYADAEGKMQNATPHDPLKTLDLFPCRCREKKRRKKKQQNETFSTLVLDT